MSIHRQGWVAITPSKTSGILESITRKTLLELFSKELGVPTEERDVDRTELYVADEAFFCGTGGGEATPLNRTRLFMIPERLVEL